MKWHRIFRKIMDKSTFEVYEDRDYFETRLPEGSVNAYTIVDILSRKKKGVDSYSCVLELLDYANEIIEDDNEFYQEAMMKDIEINWELPWYQEQLSVTKKTGTIPSDTFCKQGVFIPPEIKIMKKNWRDLCVAYDIPDQPESLARWKSEVTDMRYKKNIEITRRQIVKWLAKGLQRTLYQVYTGFVSYYGRYRVGPYNKREKNVMKVIFKWVKRNGGATRARQLKLVRLVSILLCREKRGIQKFMNNILKESEETKVERKAWTLQRANTLVLAMLEISEYTNVTDLKDEKFNAEFWRTVSSKINEPTEAIRLFWFQKLHVMLFAEDMYTRMEIVQKLRKIIKKTTFTYWQEVNFDLVCAMFPSGYTPMFLKVIFFEMVLRGNRRGRPASTKIRRDSKMRLDYLLNHMSFDKDRKLRKVRLSNGVLEYAD